MQIAQLSSDSLYSLVLMILSSGGTCKAFGVANGQLSDPIIAASTSTLSKDSAVPYDDREQEVLYAGLVAAISTTWISFEVSVGQAIFSVMMEVLTCSFCK
jgi:hypothetical protein